ncbi:hypothetical protein H0H92_013606 [Tricholoma furcatifolium]|nr:hypothetical protein H0H92_013606 [Tricholoma furcatifolium]
MSSHEQDKIHTLKANDTAILVLGQVGSGKSSFINSIMGRDVASVNHSFIEGSHTKAITAYAMETPPLNWDNGRVVLVDTPGFNASPGADIQNLQRIIAWLSSSNHSAQPPMVFAAIIYIQEITQSRLPPENDYMHPGKISKVAAVLVTAKWGELGPELLSRGLDRENEIRVRYGNLYGDGARIVRCSVSDAPSPSLTARDIVAFLLPQRTEAQTLHRTLAGIFGVASGKKKKNVLSMIKTTLFAR